MSFFHVTARGVVGRCQHQPWKECLYVIVVGRKHARALRAKEKKLLLYSSSHKKLTSSEDKARVGSKRKEPSTVHVILGIHLHSYKRAPSSVAYLSI